MYLHSRLPSNHLLVLPDRLSTCLPICCSTHPCIRPSVRHSLFSCTGLSFHLFFSLSVYLPSASTRLSFHKFFLLNSGYFLVSHWQILDSALLCHCALECVCVWVCVCVNSFLASILMIATVRAQSAHKSCPSWTTASPKLCHKPTWSFPWRIYPFQLFSHF